MSNAGKKITGKKKRNVVFVVAGHSGRNIKRQWGRGVKCGCSREWFVGGAELQLPAGCLQSQRESTAWVEDLLGVVAQGERREKEEGERREEEGERREEGGRGGRKRGRGGRKRERGLLHWVDPDSALWIQEREQGRDREQVSSHGRDWKPEVSHQQFRENSSLPWNPGFQHQWSWESQPWAVA